MRDVRDFQKMVVSNIDKIVRAAEKLPSKIGNDVVNHLKDNIRNGGFEGSTYPPVLRSTLGFRDGAYGPLLSRTNNLLSSIRYEQSGPYKVRIFVNDKTAPYGIYQNAGAEATVTEKSKRYFWHKYYEIAGSIATIDKGAVRKSKRNISLSSEASFWKNMALKRIGSRIRIPQRQFFEKSAQVEHLVNERIKKDMEQIIRKYNGINS